MNNEKPSGKDTARQVREKRLAEALRANLKRRKAAAKDAAAKSPQVPKGSVPQS